MFAETLASQDGAAHRREPSGSRSGGPSSNRQILRRSIHKCIAPVEQRPIQCLAIGASTGGIHALSQFFTELPREVAPFQFFVTQHLPTDFIVYFARQLESISGRKAIPARDGQRVTGDEILIAVR